MSRRVFLLGAAASAMLATAGARGQQKPRIRRVVYVATSTPLSDMTGANPANKAIRAFVHGMRELGYVRGENLLLDMRTLEGRMERMHDLATELVRLGSEVVVLPTHALAPAMRKASKDVPLVMIVGGEIVRSGLVHSLARPGNAMTGISVDAGADQEAKRLQLLHETAPNVRRIAFIASEQIWRSDYGASLMEAARRLGITLVHVPTKPPTYTDAFANVVPDRVDGFLVSHGPVEYGYRRQIGEFAARSRLPSSCAHGETVEHGCLVSYGVDIADVCRRLAGHVDKILKGANAGDLPIEQPTRFELFVNLNTAKKLGIAVPQSVLLRADRVIE